MLFPPPYLFNQYYHNMKKFLLVFFAGAIILSSCNKTQVIIPSTDDELSGPIVQRKCGSMEVLEAQLNADPGLRKRMDDVEAFTRRFVADPKNARLSGDQMIVPVVVNVLYKSAAENISAAQIQSQIDVLNEDYKGTNGDISNVPGLFVPVKAADTKISFELSTVVRKQTSKKSWSTNDAMKKSSQGGIDPTSPATTLNIWVCTLGNGLLGYAQFPGGNAATDGVVILNRAFGSRVKYPSGYYVAAYDLGRTASHEVGHYFNLRHIWGDANCGNDFIDDTPLHNTANYGCPAPNVKSSCTGTPVMMTMNYMDYTDDACMYMFSAGQKTRMQASFALGGPHATLR